MRWVVPRLVPGGSEPPNSPRGVPPPAGLQNSGEAALGSGGGALGRAESRGGLCLTGHQDLGDVE